MQGSHIVWKLILFNDKKIYNNHKMQYLDGKNANLAGALYALITVKHLKTRKIKFRI